MADMRQTLLDAIARLSPGTATNPDVIGLEEAELKDVLLDARDIKRGKAPSRRLRRKANLATIPKGGPANAIDDLVKKAPSLLGGAAWPLALMFLVPQLLSSGMDIWKTGKEIDLAKRGQANESMANAMLVQRQANRDAQSRADALAARKEEMSLMQSMASREQQEAASNRIMGLLMGGQGDRMNLSRGPGSTSDEDIRRLAAMGKLSVWDKLGIQ